MSRRNIAPSSYYLTRRASTRAALRVMRAFATASSAAVLGMAATTAAPAALAATPALIMGGTGIPTPSQAYMDAAINRFIKPALGGDYRPVATYTPEEGLGTLPGETMSIAESTVAGLPYLEAAMAAYSGQPIVVFGYSQSGAIGAVEKNRLAAYAEAHPDEPVPDVTFVLLACGCRANGAQEFRQGSGYDSSIVDSRARTDTPFETIDVAWQYDFSSDTPVYPINLLADLNWLLGGLYVHTNYLPVPAELGGYPNGGQVPTLQGLQGVTAPGVDTTYYLIPSENLPLFGPLRSLGVPEALIDIIEPVVRVMVEWGYDRTIPPWEPTPYRLIPNINPLTATVDLITALGQGIGNALKIFGINPSPEANVDMSATDLRATAPDTLPDAAQQSGGALPEEMDDHHTTVGVLREAATSAVPPSRSNPSIAVAGEPTAAVLAAETALAENPSPLTSDEELSRNTPARAPGASPPTAHRPSETLSGSSAEAEGATSTTAATNLDGAEDVTTSSRSAAQGRKITSPHSSGDPSDSAKAASAAQPAPGGSSDS